MLAITLVVFVISAAMTVRAIAPERWSHWWDFSRRSAVAGVVITFLLLAVVSVLGVVARHLTAPGDDNLQRDAAAALLAHASLRRNRSSERGATLALGLVPELHSWVNHFVRGSIADWADALPEADLVRAAAALDNKSKGLRARASMAQRARWRRKASARLQSADVDVREEARDDLLAMIETGYSDYLLRKKR